jgi:hypothetical protein
LGPGNKAKESHFIITVIVNKVNKRTTNFIKYFLLILKYTILEYTLKKEKTFYTVYIMVQEK